MNNRLFALLAALAATTIYGLNHTIAKVVMPDYIGAFGFIMLRVVGASALFWFFSLWTPREKIDRADYLRLFFAALLGMCINMLMFFKGLELSTPINSGVIVTLTPIIVLILSVIFLNERLGTRKILGIAIGFSGALLLILYGAQEVADAPNITLGCEFYHANYYLHEDVLAQPFPIEHGQVVVPDAPGLGVEVSLEKIERYAV